MHVNTCINSNQQQFVIAHIKIIQGRKQKILSLLKYIEHKLLLYLYLKN